MDKVLIDTLKRTGEITYGENNSAFIVSAKYHDNSNFYSTDTLGIDYKIAQELNCGNKYLNYSHDGKSFTIYNIKDKIIDNKNNIILFADNSKIEDIT